MSRKCKDCKWFQKKERWTYGAFAHECRRYPPSWVRLPTVGYPSDFRMACVHPEVREGLDACGEWEERQN